LGEIIRRTRGGRFIGFYLRWYEGGKRRQLASKQATYTEARRMLQAIEGRVARGLAGIDPPRPQVPTLRELTERFLSEYSRPQLKDPAAYRVHARMALRRVLPILGARPADSIRSFDVAKLRDALKERYAAGSVRMALTFLRTAYSWAVKAGIVSVNPCRGVEQPGARALLEFLSREETKQLLTYSRAHAPDRFPMLAAALHTGLRKGELFGLRWRDVDLASRRLDVERSYRGVPKGGKPRHLRLPALLVPILEEWRRRCPPTPEGLVFPVVRRGGAARMGRPQDMLDLPELLTAAGCPALERPWHAMRHTMASHFIMQGGNLLTLQKILGHSDLKQTLQYSHLAPDFLGDEMDRLKF
jgi:integrase